MCTTNDEFSHQEVFRVSILRSLGSEEKVVIGKVNRFLFHQGHQICVSPRKVTVENVYKYF